MTSLTASSALIALIMSGGPPRKSPSADPKAAVSALEKMHSSLELDRDGIVTGVRLHPQGGTLDDAFPHLRNLTRLARLALYTDNLSADGFLALGKLPALIEVELHAPEVKEGPGSGGAAPCPRLTWDKLPRVSTIRLSGGGIGDAQLRDVATSTVVQNLFLGQVAVTEKGLAHLREIRTLELLCVQSSKVTADGVKALVGIENLKSLTLSATALGQDGFRLLAGMTGLEYLSLESTKATDADVAHLAVLAKLTHLDLGYNSGVTDAGLKHLTGLRRLAGLRLYETKVTDDGVAELKRSLPKLTVGK
jgi:hypothetical protein